MKRFWEKVDKQSNRCWIWTASKTADGYGWFGFERKTRRANRVAWMLAKGPIPPGLLVLHRCDNPSCVNPDHLFLGTHQDNVTDCVKKGRHFIPRNPPQPFCKKGLHAMTGWNLMPMGHSHTCRACKNLREKAWKARKHDR